MNKSCPPSRITDGTTVWKIVCLMNICLKIIEGINVVNFSNSWRSTKADEFLPDTTGNLTIQGISNLAFWLTTKQHFCCVRDIRQCQKLTQQTLVHPIRELQQMPMALLLHAFGTSRISISSIIMNVERRDEEHWQIYCQKHP